MVRKNQPIEERRICFGSRTTRSRWLPTNSNNIDSPSPFSYHCDVGLVRHYPNKTGYTLLASKTPRERKSINNNSVPPVGTYDIEVKKPTKQDAKPFGIGEKLRLGYGYQIPGPGTYNTFKRQIHVCTSFGHDRIIQPLVQISCAPFNTAYCSKCEETPVGDYWHNKRTNEDMCRPCMDKEQADLKKCDTKVLVRHRKKNKLKMYTLMRYCDFFHEHSCTKAAVQHMTTKDLVLKLRKENYLASYGL